jgi:hypothetical protein
MTGGRLVVLEVSLLEAAHLAGMTRQFVELLDEADAEVGADPAAGAATRDPAIARLVPDAYPHDPEASEEFRRLTSPDLLARRRADAGIVLSSLSPDGTVLDPAALDHDTFATPVVITLDDEETAAWMRMLAALRLVLASRLGIASEDDHDAEDPRFGIYEWLGYRLEGLLEASDRSS